MNNDEQPNPRQELEKLIAQQGGNSLENCNERIPGIPTGSEHSSQVKVVYHLSITWLQNVTKRQSGY